MPIADRLDYKMATSCTMKSIVRHHLYMKTGSGYDRTFSDCMMTFVFERGKTDIQKEFRKSEIGNLIEAQLTSTQDDFEKVIADYQVSSNEHIKHITNEMLMLGHCDSDSHSRLMVYIRSRAANRERNYSRTKEFLKGKKQETAWKPWNQYSYGDQGWRHFSDSTWRDFEYSSQPDSSYHWYHKNDKLLRLPPLATIQSSFGLHDLPGVRFSEARLRELTRKRHNESRPIDPHRRQDYFQ